MQSQKRHQRDLGNRQYFEITSSTSSYLFNTSTDGLFHIVCRRPVDINSDHFDIRGVTDIWLEIPGNERVLITASPLPLDPLWYCYCAIVQYPIGTAPNADLNCISHFFTVAWPVTVTSVTIPASVWKGATNPYGGFNSLIPIGYVSQLEFIRVATGGTIPTMSLSTDVRSVDFLDNSGSIVTSLLNPIIATRNDEKSQFAWESPHEKADILINTDGAITLNGITNVAATTVFGMILLRQF